MSTVVALQRGRIRSAAATEIWLPGPGFGERLIRLAEDLGVTGPRVFDLQIALVAFEGGATELWTYDRAFVTIPGLPVRDPLALTFA